MSALPLPGAGAIPGSPASYIPPIDITPIATSSAAANQSNTAFMTSPFTVGGGGGFSSALPVLGVAAVLGLIMVMKR